MSELRTQLEIAKDEYKAAKYPGDLVADVAGRRRAGNPLRLFVPLAPYAAIAAAAAVAWMIWLKPGTPEVNPTGTPSVAVNTPSESNTSTYVQMPSDVVPSIPTATMAMPAMSVPSVPSIPTWSVSTDVSLEESSSSQG
jgi:hypothetical protein